VVKTNDHLMDCTRYLIRSGLSIARVVPIKTYMIKHNLDQVEYNPLTYRCGQ